MTDGLSCWETTRLSKHFILLDFMADHEVYRCGRPLAFNDIWNDEHDALARGLCNRLLEPLMEVWGPISIADAFWPSVFKSGHASPKKYLLIRDTPPVGMYVLNMFCMRGSRLWGSRLHRACVV